MTIARVLARRALPSASLRIRSGEQRVSFHAEQTGYIDLARWEAEIAAMRRALGGLAMTEECKWGKPTHTVDGKNGVIMQGFKEYFALGFFQGALLKDSKKMLPAIFEGRGFLERR